MTGPQERPARPFGILAFGGFFLLAGALLLARAGHLAATQPAAAATLRGALTLLVSLVLPAVWAGAAGWAMLAGRAWARPLVLAMAALALVLVAGMITGLGRSPAGSVRAGVALGILAVAGGAAWYLSTERVRSWLR